MTKPEVVDADEQTDLKWLRNVSFEPRSLIYVIISEERHPAYCIRSSTILVTFNERESSRWTKGLTKLKFNCS